MSWKTRVVPTNDGSTPEIRIGDDIVLKFVQIGQRAATIIIEAPREMPITRVSRCDP
ncbi:carbon storage regulator [Frigidibacter oleivorans]|uniref:carbon storage regulator n=1 Tax=Frigidibacter oleivorans TaxID=2487129 RepID=UPI0013DF22DD|nr:carbon storage regulator [Frigidibacter oleivorans]